MGSVKDLKVYEQPFENSMGRGTFTFSDRYSVFDWGEMPDKIKNKGATLAMMAAFNFEELEKIGIRNHCLGLVDGYGLTKRFSVFSEGFSSIMDVKLANVYHPIQRRISPDVTVYDYSFYEANAGQINNYLLPLEIIIRGGLPKGSSVFKRIAKAKQITDSIERENALNVIYTELGIDHEPQVGEMLPKPIVGYTTKLEAGDRILTESEAYKISGLYENDFNQIKNKALEVNEFVSGQAKKSGFDHYDGKIEMGWNNGLVIVDVAGTLDEDRFMKRGRQVSKEILRQFYIEHQPEWNKACEEAKKTGKGWQERCKIKPIKLSLELVDTVSQMYQAGCNQYTGRKVFGDVPDLETVMDKLDKIVE